MSKIEYWVDEQVIGDSELHVSHVCPQDNIGCAKYSQICLKRGYQREILKQHGYKE